MKRIAIATLAFAVALTAVSCQKEGEISPSGEGMTICAVSESIGSEEKLVIAYKYDALWSSGDRILVRNSEKSVEFTLTGGAGTTEGIFSSQEESISGKVEGFYPSSIVTDGGLEWPAEQQGDLIVPMYSRKTLSSTKDQTFSFSSLGSVLQIVFNVKQENIFLASIKIADEEKPLSGAFTVDADGRAVITSTDKTGITLKLRESGVKLGNGANFFNIAVPAGDYQKLTLTFTATDGAKCKFSGGKLNIAPNTVGKLMLTGKEFKSDPVPVEGVSLCKSEVSLSVGNTVTLSASVLPENATDKSVSWSSDDAGVATVDATGKVKAVAAGTARITATTTDGAKTATCTVTVIPLPDGALPGVFTVADDGQGHVKKVHISKGNLYAINSLDSQCEGNFRNATANDTEIDLFTWGYGSWSTNPITTEFCRGDFSDWGSQIGDGETWRTLTADEWQFLLNIGSYKNAIRKDKCKWVKVHGQKGFVIAPDDFAGTLKDQYTDNADLAADNLVFLPNAGFRGGSKGTAISKVSSVSYYWSSSPVDDNFKAYYLCVLNELSFFIGSDNRSFGYSVRLVSDCL